MLSAAIVDCLQGIVNSRPFPKITKIRGSVNKELDQLGETTMDAAHIHLLLNHIPILGTVFGLLLLCYGTWRHSDEIKKASLGTFVIVALITIVVYLTGDGAAQIVGNLPGVSDAIIRRHDNAATLTFWPIEILGVLSLLSLWLGRGDRGLKAGLIGLILVIALICSGLASWTGSIGGQIRHTEVRPGFSK